METLLYADPRYPERWRALPDPPASIEVRGSIDARGPVAAIVGSRDASAEGARIAFELGRGLGAAGVLVVSGGALGIDAEAHRGALAGGGRTVAVLPTGVARPAPAGNRELFERVVAAGGGLVAEPSGPVGRHRFFRRNRLVAALADLVLVVEARHRSGTLHTVEAARALSRPIAAVPWSWSHPQGQGCLALLAQGAHLVRSVADALHWLGVESGKDSCPLDPLAARLSGRGETVEELADGLGWPLERVMAELLRLEVLGLAVSRGGRFTAGEGRGVGTPPSSFPALEESSGSRRFASASEEPILLAHLVRLEEFPDSA